STEADLAHPMLLERVARDPLGPWVAWSEERVAPHPRSNGLHPNVVGPRPGDLAFRRVRADRGAGGGIAGAAGARRRGAGSWARAHGDVLGQGVRAAHDAVPRLLR